MFDAAVRWCVPVFVVISGLLLITPASAEAGAGFYRQRLPRLLWPLLFWGLLYNLLEWRNGAALGGLARQWWAGAPHFHLWFLPMLAGLYVLAPWLARVWPALSAVRRRWVLLGLAMLAALHAASHAWQGWHLPAWFFLLWPPFLLYFLYGHSLQGLGAPSRLRIWAGAGVFALGFLVCLAGLYLLAPRYGLQAGLYVYDYLSPMVLAMSWGVLELLRALRKPLLGAATPVLARMTLGVYLMHPLALHVLDRSGVWKLWPPTWWGQWSAIPVTALALSLLVCAVCLRVPGLRRVV